MPSSFSIALAVGTAVGGIWLLLMQSSLDASDRLAIQATVQLEGYLVLIMGCLVGARAGYTLSHFPPGWQIISEIITFHHGGLCWSGAAVGGFVALGLFLFWSRAGLWRLIDLISLPLLIAHAAAWEGVLLSGGLVNAIGLSKQILFIRSGLDPGIAAVMSSLSLLVIVWLLPRRWPLAGFSIAGISAIKLFIEYLINRPSSPVQRVEMNLVFPVCLLIGSLIMIALRFQSTFKTQAKSSIGDVMPENIDRV